VNEQFVCMRGTMRRPDDEVSEATFVDPETAQHQPAPGSTERSRADSSGHEKLVRKILRLACRGASRPTLTVADRSRPQLSVEVRRRVMHASLGSPLAPRVARRVALALRATTTVAPAPSPHPPRPSPGRRAPAGNGRSRQGGTITTANTSAHTNTNDKASKESKRSCENFLYRLQERRLRAGLLRRPVLACA
jgi:hypothetical protein